MSTPKKPGTDLAALKARLAKKNQGAQAAPPPPPPGMGGPGSAPLVDVPAAAPPAPPPSPSRAAPSSPFGGLPAPGEAPRRPPPQPEPTSASPSAFDAAPPPTSVGAVPPSDDPFGAGAGAFDPSEGIIESGGGDYKGKSNIGLTAFIFAVGVGVGIAGGWLGHTITSKSAQVDVGKTKGAQMVEGVQQISEGRKSVSLAMEGLTQKMGQDPKAAATEIESLLKDKFDLQQRIDGLFGWQLASVHKSGIDRTFQLYDEANRLKTDLGYLAAFLSTHAEALQAGGGPGNFAVLVKGDSAGTILAALEPLCGENPQNAQPCPPDKSGDAVAIRAIDSLAEGAEPKVFPLGNDPGQAVLLGKDGVYAYAVGMEPNKNAIVFRDSLLARINGHLEAMAKAEKAAMASLQNYADSPNVDGPAPEPPAE